MPTSSINQSIKSSKGRALEKPHLSISTTTWAAKPASRSDAGLGGYERVAQALAATAQLPSRTALEHKYHAFHLPA